MEFLADRADNVVYSLLLLLFYLVLSCLFGAVLVDFLFIQRVAAVAEIDIFSACCLVEVDIEEFRTALLEQAQLRFLWRASAPGVNLVIKEL